MIPNDFLNQLEQIKWFENSGNESEKYHVVYSIFEAYDDWNQQMLEIWEPNICSLEEKAQEVIGDVRIDEIFSDISEMIGDKLWSGYCAFVERCNLEEESGLETEIMDFVKRDISWACIEDILGIEGFFTKLLEIYKEGYFPCSWIGSYSDGTLVVM